MKAQILNPEASSIQRCSTALLAGDVVGVPTETVYGLAGNAHNTRAVQKIFETKERPTFDPLIVHVAKNLSSLAALEKQGIIDCARITPDQQQGIEHLIQHFWPGPLTLILPKHKKIPDLITAGYPTVAVRMPRHPVMQALLQHCQLPLAAPSANRFAHISPTSAQAVFEELGDRIDLILDGGPCEIGVESTIIEVISEKHLKILRWGGIAIEKLKALGFQIDVYKKSDSEILGAQAPGMLEKHYSPTKPFFLLDAKTPFTINATTKKIGILSLAAELPQKLKAALQQQLSQFPQCSVVHRSLSQNGDLGEIAHNLFAYLRELDADAEIHILYCEPCTATHGLGYAIADRLKRAAARG